MHCSKEPEGWNARRGGFRENPHWHLESGGGGCGGWFLWKVREDEEEEEEARSQELCCTLGFTRLCEDKDRTVGEHSFIELPSVSFLFLIQAQRQASLFFY